MQIKTLEEIIDDYDRTLADMVIDRDQYKTWKHNLVTEKFMAECSRAAIEAIVDDNDSLLENIETVALRAAYIKGMRHAFEMVVEWQPLELEPDD